MLGDTLVDLFSGLGLFGGLVSIFLIFYFDAMIIPLLPEFFAVLFFLTDPTLQWGILVLLIAEIGEVLGNSTLYFVVKRIGVPGFLKKSMNKWVNFLMLKDERLILSNRIAPTVPFVGAFIAVCEWDYKRSITYVAVGGLVKYTVLLSVVAAFDVAYPRDLAQTLTLIFVVAFVAVSLVVAQVKSRRDRSKAARMTKEKTETQDG
jgi:hypothetical protein